MAAKVNLELLVREGCHLCDEAKAAVDRVVAELSVKFPQSAFKLDLTDIDANPQLLDRYSDEVPVLFVNGEQRAFWRIDENRLRALLAQLAR